MSKSFTYQIDEKNLRRRLQAVTVPLNTDAWQWFDLHGGLEKPLPVKKLINLHLNFNWMQFKPDRRVVMYAAFISAILLLAFTLVSFLSLRRDKDPGALKAEAASVTHPAEPARPAAASRVENHQDISIRVPSIHIASEIIAKTDPPPAAQPKPVRIAKVAPVVNEPLLSETLEPVVPIQLPVNEEPELR
jgi:hypothetical protein